MAEAKYIPRHPQEAGEYSFDHLRSLGITCIQELAGNTWTDYNEHDPGITILEQICYALTDILYRADFPVADFLTDDQGVIDWERQSLLPAERAFPSRPTMELDYRQIILDTVPEVENVRFEAVPDRDGTPTGLYQVFLRLQVETAGLGREGPTRNSASASQRNNPEEQRLIVEKVRRVFASARNLCEEIDSIVMTPTADYKLKAEVEIEEGFDPATVLAQIYHVCGLWLAAGLEFVPYARALAQGTSPEEMFHGPLVRSGMITNSVRQSRTEFPAVDVYSLIKAIPGVERVKAFPGEIDAHAVAGAVLRLHWPQKDDEIGVKIFSNHRERKVSVHELNMRFEELNFTNRGMRSNGDHSIVPRPTGQARDLPDYLSVQYQFPALYGMGFQGLPASAPPREQARVRQLKGYLLFFDQHMADMLATLGNLRQLYSTELKKGETYLGPSLTEENFPGMGEIADQEDLVQRKQQFGLHQHTSRVTRLLDYLLALYGESFRDDPLIQPGLNQTSEESKAILEARIAYLKEIASITRDRAAATDYSEPPGRRSNRSGLESKLNHLLGFEQHNASTGEGVRVIEHILLRPVNWRERREPAFPFRISVLFPAWMPRCRDLNFRRFAAETVDSCCPAHIYADIYWLRDEQMKQFDALHQRWWSSHREEAKARELLAFLTDLERKEHHA